MSRSSATPETLQRFAGVLRDYSARIFFSVRELQCLAHIVSASVQLEHYAKGVTTLSVLTCSTALAFISADTQTAMGRSLVTKKGPIRNVLNRLSDNPQRVFLRSDSSGDGTVVEVLGDLANAERIVFVIPGMTNTLENYETDLLPKAQAVKAEMEHQQPGVRVAVVVWLGYDTPDLSLSGLRDAANSKVAKDGAAALLKDLKQVRALNVRAPITLIGHSYGSVVVGQAMKSGLDAYGVDNAIAVGSPGMDADDRQELKSPRTRLWAAKASGPSIEPILPGVLPATGVVLKPPRDLVAYAPVHGEDPSASGFGATRFDAQDAKSHGDYFRKGTDSLKAMAAIALGRRR
jgi:Alpha/beta hydrolase